MSENLDLVRSLYADWERGDFRSVEWADPEMELVMPESLVGEPLRGLTSTAQGRRDWLSAWDGYRAEAREYRDIGDGRVLVVGHMSGRGKTSGVMTETETVNVFEFRDGKVTRLVLYRNRDRAFSDLGLEE